MSKNVIHNFNLSIKNSADIKSSEHLAETVIKELVKVSKEMSEQKDIVQVWQEQNQNVVVASNNFNTSTEGGATDTLVGKMKNPIVSVSTTPSVLEGKQSSIVSTGTLESSLSTASTTVPIEGRKIISNFTSTGITSSINEVENDILNKGLTSQIYSGIITQQNLLVPENFQTNSNEPAEELVKAEIKKKLDIATIANDLDAVNYWTAVYKAFDEGATVKDFNGKPDHILFTQMYASLKQTTSSVQNFNWEVTRKKMIEAIEVNILKGEISSKSKDRWTRIKDQLANNKTNIANLFERYDELFLLLKEVEGLDALPNTITITTKTKIYPNLSADKLYTAIGKEDVYVFLKQISNEEIYGSGVLSGAVKIKNTNATTFIVGESLEFFLDETLLKQKVNKKENINWVVYKNGKKEETDFVNEGTSFTYNFDTAGTYKIEAYGISSRANNKKTANDSAFVELRIITQEIQIKAPENVIGEFTRTFAEEKSFKVSLKHVAVKTLNPLKLYYQVETITANKINKISDEQELNTSGLIKLAMPDLGTYSIKIASKDQYGLVKEFKTSVIKNEVTSIGLAEKTANNNVFLLDIPNNEITLETKRFKINSPTDAEKEDVRWMIYDSNNKPYLSSRTELFENKKDPKKSYIHKWKEFTMPLPQDEGFYTIEAFTDRQKGPKNGAIFKIEMKQPELTEAYWAWSGGSKKTTSGFSGESNYIKANIPYYTNQTVRIYFYLDKAKTDYYLDVKTNEDGAIFKEIKFDSAFQKLIGFQKSKNDKIGFKLIGIQNSKPYPFKTPVNYESDTVLSVTTDKKILDVYFTYDEIRATPLTPVPYGAKVKGVIKTLNMVGSEVVLKVRRKNAQHSQLKMKTIVKSEGEASITFVLDKKWRPITPLLGISDSYYLAIEGVESKLYLENGLNAVLENNKKIENDSVKLDEDGLVLIWGGKVSVAFRQKVVAICEELWGEQQKYAMANALMIAMSVETGETFSSSLIRSTKYGYIGVSKEEHKANPSLVNNKPIGLAQFTEDAVKSLILKERGILENAKTADAISIKEVNEYKQKLALLSPEDQLDYVKTYLKLFNNHKKVKRPEDVYMIIFAPSATGQGDHVDLYKKYLTKQDEKNEKVNPKYSKNATMDTNNDGFNKGNNDEIIQSGELLARYREKKAKGIRYAIDINEARKLNQVLAEKILKSGRVTFAKAHESGIKDSAMAIDNITDTSFGKNAKRSNYENAPGGEIAILSEILYILYELSKDYKLNISEITGASHSVNSYHYKGVAIDINEIDGVHMGKKGKPGFTLAFHENIRKIVKNHGATTVLDPYNEPKYHFNHIHIEITK
ncbi:hypothetical protein [Flavobacterium sp. UBA7680]|uniref:hypothetical protein n=1 Tax=Flavobacterium sp. UBA7680 TaxID=1946559 RepID=UPI0025C051DA|nr:hypothetical protein [Flavobacterium sp. UBA7680]